MLCETQGSSNNPASSPTIATKTEAEKTARNFTCLIAREIRVLHAVLDEDLLLLSDLLQLGFSADIS